MAEGGDDWELSKENIQPLKQGRAMSSLQAALQGTEAVQQRRKDFEAELRTYSGEDPLDVWHRYIVWLEQHFPKGGYEVNMQKLLEKCIALFLPNNKYTNDLRYVSVWLRYADVLADQEREPVYRSMYDRKVGVELASLYTTWANHREAVGDCKGAAKVLRRGLSRGACPRETLEAQLRHLEARVSRLVVQQMREEGEQQEEVAEGGRSVLAPLRPVGRRGQVGTERASRTIEVQGGVGGLVAGTSNRAPRVLARGDGENDDEVFLHPVAPAPFVAAAEGAKENTSKPGKWTSAKVKQATNPVGPQFIVPQDEASSDPEPRAPEWVPGSSNVLGVHRSGGDIPEPVSKYILVQNLKERPMYDKFKVYGGTKELQFEEIRWARILAKEREQERLQREAAKDQEVRSLRLQMEQMRRELDEMRQLLQQNRNGPVQQQQAMKKHINLLEQSILVTDQSIRAVVLPAPSEPDRLAVPPLGQNASQRSSPGSGNNTVTDVSGVVRGLWNGTLIESGLEDKSLAASSNSSAEERAAHPVTAGAPFEVFREPTQTQTPSVLSCYPEVPSNAPVTDENDENGPPAGFSHLRARCMSGSLQHRVPFTELEPTKAAAEEEEGEEVVEEENGDEDGEMDGVQPFGDEENFTYAPTKSFVKKVTSTPFDVKLPLVGEDFTVGGLTAMVHEVRLEPEARQESSLAAAARRRLSVPCAVAGDLSTILEGSKESSSKSGSSSGSSAAGLSSVSAAALSGHSRLPVLQEEASLPRRRSSYEASCPEDVDPFDRALTDHILETLEVPLYQRRGFSFCDRNRPLLRPDHTTDLGEPKREFRVLRLLATGAYAKVYLAERLEPEVTFMDTDGSFECPHQQKVALKVLGDPNLWEFYISTELRERLPKDLLPSVLDSVVTVEAACVYRNGAILVMPLGQYGTLLDLVQCYQRQKTQGSKGIPESLVLYFALELLLIVPAMHECEIIHGDLKPDNVVICNLPTEYDSVERLSERTSCLQLIDFGRGIDQKPFHAGTVFTKVVETDGFKCTEMMDGRPWTFQTDWYGVVACIHLMLFGEYMEVVKATDGTWAARQKFKRYWQRDLWESLFTTLLNIPSCTQPPDVQPFVACIKELLGNHSRTQDLVLQAHRASSMS